MAKIGTVFESYKLKYASNGVEKSLSGVFKGAEHDGGIRFGGGMTDMIEY